MMRLLVVEDQPTDLQVVTDLAQALGMTLEARTSASSAKLYLEAALQDNSPLPDFIVLDLDLGYESGFELLRFWHRTPRLAGIRMIVWTVMGEDQHEICRLFKVHAVVPKWEGAPALERALSRADTAEMQ